MILMLMWILTIIVIVNTVYVQQHTSYENSQVSQPQLYLVHANETQNLRFLHFYVRYENTPFHMWEGIVNTT